MSMSLPNAQANRLCRLDFASAMKIAVRKLLFSERLKRGDVSDAEMARLKAFQDEQALADPSFAGVKHFLANTAFKLGPIALTTVLTTNIFNPGTTTGGVNCTGAPFDKLFVTMRRFGITNKTGSAATASLWIGATGANAAGTEFWVQATSVPANAPLAPPWFGNRRFAQADFLVGGAGTTTALAIDGDGEIGIGA